MYNRISSGIEVGKIIRQQLLIDKQNSGLEIFGKR
jgi:hypothetical protein